MKKERKYVPFVDELELTKVLFNRVVFIPYIPEQSTVIELTHLPEGYTASQGVIVAVGESDRLKDGRRKKTDKLLKPGKRILFNAARWNYDLIINNKTYGVISEVDVYAVFPGNYLKSKKLQQINKNGNVVEEAALSFEEWRKRQLQKKDR